MWEITSPLLVFLMLLVVCASLREAGGPPAGHAGNSWSEFLFVAQRRQAERAAFPAGSPYP